MLYIILLLAALAVWTWYRWETVSPKLLVREGATFVGAVAGATPELARTTVNAVKTANAVSELALREAGEEGPVGFRTGRAVAAEATREFFEDFNAEAKTTRETCLASIAELKANA